jgi:hypothetical protein
MVMKLYTAPDDISETRKIKGNYDFKVFLGGSIEMGKAVDWQNEVVDYFKHQDRLVLFNPRRPDWDSTWKQDPTPGTPFHEQVNWELDALNDSDYVLFYFDPNTVSPITLLELGIYSQHKDKVIVVVCPPDYFRYGNVKIVCNRERLIHFTSLKPALEWLGTDIHDVIALSDPDYEEKQLKPLEK